MIFAAFQNEVFLFYATLIGCLLLFCGGVIVVFDKLLHKNVKAARRIYYGWLMMIPIFFLCIILGRYALIIGLLGVSFIGFTEFVCATRLVQNRAVVLVGYVGITAVALLSLVRDGQTGAFMGYGVFMALPVYVVSLAMLIPILQNRAEGQLQPVALGIMGFMYFGWMFGHLAFLTHSPYALNYILFLFFAVQITDIAAYNFGKLWGRHKLRSRISPNKTVEGAVGALLVALCLPWLLAATFPDSFGPLQLVLTGIIVGVGAQLGDLTISFIKRDMRIKDMGTLIPGHGGMLDRIDSLIFVAPLFFHMARYFGVL